MKSPNGQLVLRQTLSAVVTRADGTVEDLGIIADSGLPERTTFFQRVRAAIWPKN